MNVIRLYLTSMRSNSVIDRRIPDLLPAPYQYLALVNLFSGESQVEDNLHLFQPIENLKFRIIIEFQRISLAI